MHVGYIDGYRYEGRWLVGGQFPISGLLGTWRKSEEQERVVLMSEDSDRYQEPKTTDAEGAKY